MAQRRDHETSGQGRDRGASAVEYVMIVASIACVIVVGVSRFGSRIEGSVNSSSARLSQSSAFNGGGGRGDAAGADSPGGGGTDQGLTIPTTTVPAPVDTIASMTYEEWCAGLGPSHALDPNGNCVAL